MDVSKYLGITLPTVNADQTVPPMNLKLLCEVQKKGKRMITQGYRINIPLLVIHGSEDNISLPKSSVVFSRNTGIYTTFKSLTGKDHFLTERYDTEVFGYMLQWLKSNLHILHVQA
jgi:alpha-beta hydrolase superfamily lysophospholipase